MGRVLSSDISISISISISMKHGINLKPQTVCVNPWVPNPGRSLSAELHEKAKNDRSAVSSLDGMGNIVEDSDCTFFNALRLGVSGRRSVFHVWLVRLLRDCTAPYRIPNLPEERRH